MSRPSRRTWRIRPFGGLLLALLILAVPSESRAQGAPREQLTIGITQFPSTFNPMIDAMVAKSYILGMARRPMMAFDKDWKLVCMMCTEIPTFENGRVQMIPEVKTALDAYREAGFFASGADFASGGMQLPYTVQQAAAAVFSAANVSTTAYPFLTKANANLIARFGNNWQKATFLGPLLEGRWFGTMALTEPQAGSGLADMSTPETKCIGTPE